MSSSVLYDVPGPVSRRRHRLYGVVTTLVVLAVAAWAAKVLADKGQFDAAKWDFLQEPGTWTAIRQGLQNTVKAAAVAILLALVFGAVLGAGRLSDRAWVRWPATAVVEFFRAVPLLLLILFLFLGYGDTIGTFWALVIGLVLYNGSVFAEIFRAGILAIPRGQREAAEAIGLRKAQVMRLVLVPQAVRTMLPAIISQCVVALKDTALGFVIAYAELAVVAKQIYVFYNNPLQAGLVVAGIFVLINYSLSKLAMWLEGRQRRQRRGPKAPDATRIETGTGQTGGA